MAKNEDNFEIHFIKGLYDELDKRTSEFDQKKQGGYVKRMTVSDFLLPSTIIAFILIYFLIIVFTS